MNIKFNNAAEMEKAVRMSHDLYNEKNGIYVFLYNEKGSICYYRLSNADAMKTADTVRESEEHSWSSVLGPGGYILDDPEVIEGFFRDNYREEGWVLADDQYGVAEYGTYYILKSGKFSDERTYPASYRTFEEAYDAMCSLYQQEQKTETTPNRWGIYRVDRSRYEGKDTTMVQPTWN